MERLVDPLTTVDAKLWADEFMKVKARLGEQKFDHAMMLGWFANAIMQGYDEGQRRAKADAQATVEALQGQIVSLQQSVDVLNGAYESAVARAEALQREHNEAGEALERQVRMLTDALDAERAAQKSLCDIIAELRTSLDDERERVRQNLLTIMDLQTQLTQLQALVRAFFAARGANDVEAYTKAFVEIKRTLDATTPAADTSIIGKCEPPSQWDPNAQVRGDIS